MQIIGTKKQKISSEVKRVKKNLRYLNIRHKIQISSRANRFKKNITTLQTFSEKIYQAG